MNVHEKLYHLIKVREYLTSEQYRAAVATIVAQDLVEKVQEKDISCKRAVVFDRTNLTLQSMGIPEVSYGFIRKFL
ncbi:hypothetical protein QFZ87_000208 [Bacillus sp. SLBN-46]|uniref:hypothetical protein n=1 Tax=Bacillus sp. SLBN-46 TaxID=3042283 RepID=UPI002855335C|nr:hypothetical protein [Bacillus sp. SLBN-46]MDR6120611.1 hypothetical protein [Bacillus sp. SLBN-46]